MDAALAGAIGVVSGALIGGLASYLGPLHVQRRSSALEAERAAVDKFEANVKRVIEVRVTSSLWVDSVAELLQALADGREVGVEFFTQEVSENRQLAHRAVADMLVDGVRIRTFGPADAFMVYGQMLERDVRTVINRRAAGDEPSSEEWSQLVGKMDTFRTRRTQLLDKILSDLEGRWGMRFTVR